MTLLGTVEEIWRYPVSSLGGEQLHSVNIESDGVPGDRAWGLVDAHTGNAAAPEKEARWRPALFLHSRLIGNIPEIGFPDGGWIAVSNTDIASKLSEHFGFDVDVRPYATNTRMPADGHIATPRYEPSPLHLITTSSLEHLSTLIGTDTVHSKRFRPTLLLRTESDADFRESLWVGQLIRLGPTLVAQASEETKRCGMTLIAQTGVSENPDILRTVLRQNRRNFGIYGSIETSGVVTVGDSVHLIEA
ncbi:MOSC domain-containing protein [Agrobacterium rosae]|uniref:MOSC domain-containing protein n=1 Tax=Agrobacterium rosae TaxID=1972867 RepID=A0AAW9FB15_9HYPH|nr:MOSC N-terminal beta barrel domain-containing protein [Agrobacterium rosae]MDX8302539.1 MOSC domain-containing protein [Agrobacterium rosae]